MHFLIIKAQIARKIVIDFNFRSLFWKFKKVREYFFLLNSKVEILKFEKKQLSIIFFYCLLAFIDSFPTVCWLCFQKTSQFFSISLLIDFFELSIGYGPMSVSLTLSQLSVGCIITLASA